MPLTPEDVRNKQFSTVRLREGYDMDEVDAFLDEVEAELTRLGRANGRGEARGAEAARGTAAAVGAGSARDAPRAGGLLSPGSRRFLTSPALRGRSRRSTRVGVWLPHPERYDPHPNPPPQSRGREP